MGQLRLKPQLCRLQAVTQGKTLNACESGPPHCDMVMGKKYTQRLAVPGTQSGRPMSPFTLVMGKGVSGPSCTSSKSAMISLSRPRGTRRLVVGLQFHVELGEAGDGGEHDGHALARLIVELRPLRPLAGQEVCGHVLLGRISKQQPPVVGLQFLHLPPSPLWPGTEGSVRGRASSRLLRKAVQPACVPTWAQDFSKCQLHPHCCLYFRFSIKSIYYSDHQKRELCKWLTLPPASREATPMRALILQEGP